ncbi:MAG: diguanylate cyclase, partial [Calditrichaeota bacterium]
MLNRYARDVLFSVTVLFLLLISVNIFLFPEMPGYLGLNPHPYLIAILFVAGRFGRRESYLAAVIATLLLALYIVLENYPYISLDLFRHSIFVAPALSFLLAAAFVGEMRHAGKKRESLLLADNTHLQEENQRLKEQLEIIMQIKEELESRILGQQDTIHSLYQATKALETLEEKEFYQALPRLTARFTGATRVSLYVIDYPNDLIRCAARFGREAKPLPDENFPLSDGIFSLVLKQNKIVTIKDIANHPDFLQIWEHSENKSYVYAPISMGSVIVAILAIEEIPFLKLNLSTLRILALICELAVPALRNIIHVQDLENLVHIDAVTSLPKYEAFIESAEIEFQKAARYHLDFSLVLIEVDGLDHIAQQMGHKARVEAIKWFAHHLKSMHRTIDLVGMGEHPNEFFLALSVTNSDGMLEVIERISAWIK